jgi:hypothetical protein
MPSTRHQQRRLWSHWLSIALALPLSWNALGWAFRTVEISSIRLSPATIGTGSTSSATVTLDAASRASVTVQLTSANSRLASVPATLTIAPGALSGRFTVSTTSGAAGCTDISAQVGSTQRKSARLTVEPVTPASVLKLNLPASPIVGGATARASVYIIPAPSGPTTVQLSSNHAAATVPVSVTAVPTTISEIGTIGLAEFTINTSVTSPTVCPVITANMNATTSSSGSTIGPATTKGLVTVATIGG